MDMQDVLKLMMEAETLKMVSERTGVSENDASAAMAAVLPMLLQGMQGQAKGEDTQKGFLEALMSHSKDDTSDVKAAIRKSDADDGAKIVKHLLGNDEEEIAAKAKKKSGLDTKTILKIMAIVAPILMAQMGKNAKQEKEAAKADGGIVGDILGNIDAGDVVKIIGLLMK
jgi:hypothetical protein